MNATDIEIELSKVACFLDELAGLPLDKKSGMRGYHPLVYNKGLDKAEGDKLVEKLCTALQGRDVTKHSLELQIWWRDHQEADRERLSTELKEMAHTAERQAAIAKLTPYERELLGIK